MSSVKIHHVILILLSIASVVFGGELKVDVNRDGKDLDQYTEIGYVKWSQGLSGSTTASGTTPITRSFTNAASECITISFAQTAASQSAGGTGITFLYNATAVSGSLDLIGDGLTVAPSTFAGGGQLQMTITGLIAGDHTLLTYHNGADGGWIAGSVGPLDVYVNGTRVIHDLPQTVNAAENAQAASSYVHFTVSGTNDVTTILFAADPTNGIYTIRNPMINGFEIDTPDIYRSATSPYPANEDWHADADSGSITLSWTGALAGDTAVHNVYFGTNYDAVANADTNSATFLGGQTGTNHTVTVDDPDTAYYWRVDEVNVSNEVTTGSVWSFRPRHLAFPGAEGYGRYARGGRGGKVVHVTSLSDYSSSETPIPGTLRYAVSEETGPRVIVFDVSGLITLKERLTLSDDFVTIAGQTAPGKGICLKKWPMGLSGANDAIIRFIRTRPGRTLQTITVDKYKDGTTGTPTNVTAAISMDGMGMQGSSDSILDHCSISWTIDESFSSRSAHNITLQRTLISEALNKALHPNYIFLDQLGGEEHGFAGSIGGDIGSFHHNLLAHCYGRNWSMAGGLDANANFAGRLDIRNNVVYNWGTRTTDGGAKEVDFVGNYYKPGPGIVLTQYALTMQHEDNFAGSQQCYFDGNVMPGYFDESNETDGRRSVVSSGIPTPTYQTFVDTPFFSSYITEQSAVAAYKSVLSDVGCNRPEIDNHDVRIIHETLTGSYTYSGSVTGKPGFPDVQSDVGGWENYSIEKRPDDWDTDGDGLPNWWEQDLGTNPDSPAGDFSDANADPDKDGYTQLDDYLAWRALPRLRTAPGTSVDIDLSTLTAGYTASPVFSVTNNGEGSVELLPDGHTARFTPAAGFSGHTTFGYSVSDAEGDGMSGTIGVRVGALTPTNASLGIGVSSDGIHYDLFGEPGTSYSMQYSTDISNPLGWNVFTNLTASGNIQTFDLPSVFNGESRLFIRSSK